MLLSVKTLDRSDVRSDKLKRRIIDADKDRYTFGK